MKILLIAIFGTVFFAATVRAQDINVEYTFTSGAQSKFAVKSSKKKFAKGKFESGVFSSTSDLEFKFTTSAKDSYQLEFRKSDQGEYRCYKIKGDKVAEQYRYVRQSYVDGYVSIVLKQSYTSWEEVLRFRAADPNEDIRYVLDVLDKIKSEGSSKTLSQTNTPVSSRQSEITNTVTVDGTTYIKARTIMVNGEEYTEMVGSKPMPENYVYVDKDLRTAVNNFGTRYRSGAKVSAIGFCCIFTGALIIGVDQADGIAGSGTSIGGVFFLGGGVISLVGQIQLWTAANGLKLSTDGANLKLNF